MEVNAAPTVSRVSKYPDISDALPLSEADKPLIDDLVEVLKKHNTLDRFGLSLLHQHFDIAEDEILLETTHELRLCNG